MQDPEVGTRTTAIFATTSLCNVVMRKLKGKRSNISLETSVVLSFLNQGHCCVVVTFEDSPVLTSAFLREDVCSFAGAQKTKSKPGVVEETVPCRAMVRHWPGSERPAWHSRGEHRHFT